MPNRYLEWLNSNSVRSFPLIGDSIDYNQDLDSLLLDFRVISSSVPIMSVKLIAINSTVISLQINEEHIVGINIVENSLVIDNITQNGEKYIIYTTFGDNLYKDKYITFDHKILFHPVTYLDAYNRRLDIISGGNNWDVLNDNDTHKWKDVLIPEEFYTLKDIQGDVQIAGGYGINININEAYKKVNISAIPEYGDIKGKPCYRFYDKTACSKAILSINGVSPNTEGNLTLKGEEGIKISRDYDENNKPKPGILIIKSKLNLVNNNCKG